jgi:hypothetical protein
LRFAVCSRAFSAAVAADFTVASHGSASMIFSATSLSASIAFLRAQSGSSLSSLSRFSASSSHSPPLGARSGPLGLIKPARTGPGFTRIDLSGSRAPASSGSSVNSYTRPLRSILDARRSL